MKPLKIHFIADMDKRTYSGSPHIGIGYLSAFLKQHFDGIQISLSCISDNIISDVQKYNPDIVGFTSTSRYFPQFKKLAQELKTNFDIPIIFGGKHITMAPKELPLEADLGVIGEGEETLKELLENFKDNKFYNLEKIKGIAYCNNGSIIVNPKRAYIEPLDMLPHQDLSLHKLRWGKKHRGVIITSRGCPYKCRFCASSMFWDNLRLHSPEYVVNEIKEVKARFDVNEILIYDDLFAMNKERVAKILELKKKDPSLDNLKFECHARVDCLDEEMASLLKEFGVVRVSFGIESGCQKTLNYLKNQTITLEQVEKAVETAKKYGLKRIGSFIIGSPFESAEDIKETLNFIPKLGLNWVQITIATPFQGSLMWEDAKNIGKITGDEWSEDYNVFFAIGHDTDMRKLLKEKRLITQIKTDDFIRLAQEAVRIENKINFNWVQFAKDKARWALSIIGLFKRYI